MKRHYNIAPSFIEGKQGQLFSVHFSPNSASSSECIITAPAFAEEMNRCRYTLNMLAQAVTCHGISLINIDLFGTGDSEGVFVEASWETWIEDIVAAVAYAREIGYKKISLLGVRLGSLLATEAIKQGSMINSLLLWQPTVNGKVSLNQFLRIKIAAAMAREETAGTTAEFEALINQGHALEIAGYDISPQLFKGIQSARLDLQHLSPSIPISWFSVLPSVDRNVPRTEQKYIDSALKAGSPIHPAAVVDAPFWQAHERTLAPHLVSATVKHVTGGLQND